MSGEQKTEYVTCIQTENAALKEAIIELIPMAKWYYGQYRDEKAKAAIDRAKKLLNKQPQSESDKTE